MHNLKRSTSKSHKISRRRFLQGSAAAAGSLLTGAALGTKTFAADAAKPNFVFIISDQLGLDALSAYGCGDVHTPNIDRLVQRGFSFIESHSTSPVCSPARSSMFTGRMPAETGVISNDRSINPRWPTMGPWFRQAGYETVYTGKWHLPHGWPGVNEIDGFTVLPVGNGQGDIVDPVVARSAEAFLRNYHQSKPFLLVASFLQPHDICYWAIKRDCLVPKNLPFEALADKLPHLPPNHYARPKAPKQVDNKRFTGFDENQWRYYIYNYYRQVEMLDATVGRIFDALDETGQSDNTIIVFTADHGEGRGRHQHVQKWHPYDESMKVPLILSCPGRIPQERRDTEHLVNGLDILSTMCDYADIAPPAGVRGKSIKPIIEGQPTQWREFVVADTHLVGHIIRTQRYKYVEFPNDPVRQLFDMKKDPWETKNLYEQCKYADIAKEHHDLLKDYLDHLDVVEPSPRFVVL